MKVFLHSLNFILDALKPTICAFTSLFALDHIKKLTPPTSTNNDPSASILSTYAADYCSSLQSTITNKLLILNKLSTYDPQDATFPKACVDALSKNENKWFDPVIPSDIITYGDMC